MKSRYRPKQRENPDRGHHLSDLTEIKYKADVLTNYGAQNRVSFGVDTDQIGKNGEPIRVYLNFNDTLHPSGNLYKFIVKLTGEEPKPGYDFDNLLDIPVEFDITHVAGDDGRIWANVEDIRRQRTAEEVAADERSEARLKQITAGVTNQQKKPKTSAKSRDVKDYNAKAADEGEDFLTDESVPF